MSNGPMDHNVYATTGSKRHQTKVHASKPIRQKTKTTRAAAPGFKGYKSR